MYFFLKLLSFIQYLKEILQANKEYPGQTHRSAASGLVLHCLLMSHKKDTMLNLSIFMQSRQGNKIISVFFYKNIFENKFPIENTNDQ